MFERTLTEQALFFLNIRGQSLFVTSITTKFRVALCLLLESFVGVLMIIGLFLHADDMYTLLENITALATLIQTGTKSIILLLYKDDFLKGIKFLQKFWRSDKFGKAVNKQMDNYRLFIGKVLRIFRLVIATAALATQLLTIVGFDGLFFTLLISGYAELEQIKYAFTDVNIQKDEEETLQEMASIIEHHNLVLEYIGKFNKLFQTALIVQFGISIFSLCSSLFIMTVNGFPPTMGNFLKSGPYGFSAFFQILIYSVVGEKIAEQTESISDVIYNMEWPINYQPKFRKMLVLIIQRAQKRLQITAGGIWDLNMSTFASILKGSMSLLAFMQTVYGNKEEQI